MDAYDLRGDIQFDGGDAIALLSRLDDLIAVVEDGFQDLGTRVEDALDGANRSIEQIDDTTKRTVKSFSESMAQMGQSVTVAGQAMSDMGDRLTNAITRPLMEIAKASIGLASDLGESQNKVNVVFGQSADVINKFASTSASSLGLSRQKALEATSTFGNLFTAMKIGQPAAADMSVNLVKLAGDLASFNNLAPEEALEKLRAGITGEAEPLKSMGILINDTTTKAKAMELGFKAVGGQFTESEKVQARYALMLEQTKNAAGDFSETSTGLANSQRILRAQFEDLQAELGTKLLPYVNKGIIYLNQMLDAFRNLPSGVQDTILVIAGLAAAIGPVLLVVGQLTTAVGSIMSVVGALGGMSGIISGIGSALTFLTGPIGIAIALVVGLAAAYATNFGGIRDVVNSTIKQIGVIFEDLREIFNNVVAALSTQADAFNEIWSGVKEIVKAVVVFIANQLSALIDIISGIIKVIKGDWEGGWELIKSGTQKYAEGITNLVITVLGAIPQILSGIWELVKAGAAAAWEGIQAALAAAWGAVVNYFTSTAPGQLAGFFDWFKGIPGRIGEFLSTLPTTIGQLVGLALAELVKFAISAAETLVSWAKAAPGAIINFLSNLPSMLFGLLSTVVAQALKGVTWLYETFKEWVGKVPGLVLEMGKMVLTYLRELPGQVLQAAIDFGKGIWDGFRQGFDKKSPSGPEKDVVAMVEGIQVILKESEAKLYAAGKLSGKALADAFKDGIKTIEDWAKSVGYNLDLALQDWDMFSKEAREKLKAYGAAHDRAVENERHAQKELATTYRVTLGEINKYLSELGIKHTFTAVEIAKQLEEIQEGLQKNTLAWLENKKRVEENAKAMELWAAASGLPIANLRKIEDLVRAMPKLDVKQLGIDTVNLTAPDPAKVKEFWDMIARTGEEFKKLEEEAERAAHRIPKSWGIITDAIAKGTGLQGADLLKTKTAWKNNMGDILDMLDTMPGKVGDKLRGITGAVTQWLEFINSALKNLHKIWAQIPDSLGGVIEKITGIFKKGGSSATTAAHSIGGAAASIGDSTGTIAKDSTQAASVTSQAFGTAAGAIGAFATGMATAASTGSKALGSLMGAAQGAISGFATGGPIGALIGGVSGLLGGLFGGKSKHVKAMEALAEEKARLEIAGIKEGIKAAYQKTIQEALSTMREALELFTHLADFSAIPKESIRLFFRNLTQVLNLFIELSGNWTADMLSSAAKFAERMAPVVDVIGAGVDAFTKLENYRGATAENIRELGEDLEVAATVLGEVSIRIPNSLEKQARKFAERMEAPVQLVGEATEAFQKLGERGNTDVKAALLRLAEDLDVAAQVMAEISDNVDLGLQKAAARFSERMLPVVTLIGTTVDAFQKVGEYRGGLLQPLMQLAGDIDYATQLMIIISEKTDTELLGEAAEFASTMMEISTALGNSVDSFNKAAGFVGFDAGTLDKFKGAFDQVVSLLVIMAVRAEDAKDISLYVADLMNDTAANVADAMDAIRRIGGLVSSLPAGGAGGVSIQATAPIYSSPVTPGVTSQSGYSRQVVNYVQVTADMSRIRTMRDMEDLVDSATRLSDESYLHYGGGRR